MRFLILRQDISFTRRRRGLTAVGALIFAKTIFGHHLVSRETNKPINYQMNIEYWDDHGEIRLEHPRREIAKSKKIEIMSRQKKYKFIIILTYEFVFTKYSEYTVRLHSYTFIIILHVDNILHIETFREYTNSEFRVC